VLLLTPNAKFNAYFNFDVGQNKSGSGLSEFTARWYGVAGALHVQPTSKWSFTPRLEWFKDRDGFSTGTAQDVKEVTLTGEYKMVEGFLTRFEYRHDWSNQPFFDETTNSCLEEVSRHARGRVCRLFRAKNGRCTIHGFFATA